MPVTRKLLILVNPVGGAGKALTTFKQKVVPMLGEADIPYKMIVTKCAGHARDLMLDLERTDYYGIVVVSGDGLIYEVINGLMRRPDWEQFIQIPIGCLPGGSGNALCCSINYRAGEPIENTILHSTIVLIKHNICKMDLVAIQTPSQNVYSFLSATWGMIADVDYESEKFRYMGETRMLVGTFKSIMSFRKYKGRVSFLPINKYVPKANKSSKNSQHDVNEGSNDSFENGTEHSSQSERARTMSSPDGRLSGVFSSKQHSKSQCFDKADSGNDELMTSSSAPNSSQTTEDAEAVVHDYAVQEYLQAVDVDSEGQGLNGDVSNSSETSPSNTWKSERDHMQTASRTMIPESKNTSTNNAMTLDVTQNSLPAAKTLPEKSSTSDTAVLQLSTESTEIDQNNKSNYSKTNASDQGAHGYSKPGPNMGDNRTNLPPTPLLSPLSEPVPDNWVVIDDEFLTVLAAYQTHLGSDLLTSPPSLLNDGAIYLYLIRSGISRSAAINIFLKFSDGSHLDMPEVEMIKVSAFRFEPEGTDGNIMVDGEPMDYGPIQGQIMPGMARVMAIQ